MTITIAAIVNGVLAVGILTALALVVRAAHRLPHHTHEETVHPSQPIELALFRAADEERELARVA